MLSRNFKASHRHPKSEASLEEIIQGRNEYLRAYIECFNKECVQVSTTNDMKKFLLEHGIHPCSDFSKSVGIGTLVTLDTLLLKAQSYIQYKENEAANNARGSRHRENAKASKNDEPSTSRRGGEKNREDKL